MGKSKKIKTITATTYFESVSPTTVTSSEITTLEELAKKLPESERIRLTMDFDSYPTETYSERRQRHQEFESRSEESRKNTSFNNLGPGGQHYPRNEQTTTTGTLSGKHRRYEVFEGSGGTSQPTTSSTPSQSGYNVNNRVIHRGIQGKRTNIR